MPLDAHLFGTASSVRSMPLYVEAGKPSPRSGRATLYARGSSSAGTAGWAPLFLSVVATQEGMPLFLAGSPVDRAVRSVVLSVGGGAGVLTGLATLMVANTQRGAVGSTTLFVKAAGGLEGGRLAGEGMALFLKRPAEAGVALVLHGPGTVVTASAPLCVKGGVAQAGSTTLAMPHTSCVLPSQAPLYVNGW
jgi:hypothetical protein